MAYPMNKDMLIVADRAVEYDDNKVDTIFSEGIYPEEPSLQHIDNYLKDFGQNIVTSISVVTLVLGLVSNTVVLVYFYRIFDRKPIQISLWANMSWCYLAKCLVMLYSAVGDTFDFLSNTEEKCRVRYALPLSMDIVCISCFLMILMERIIALHCPAFYSILPEHGLLLHCFAWAYGGSYFMFIVLHIQYYDCPSLCDTPYTHMTPVDSVQTCSFVAAVSMIMACLTSMLFLYPSHYSKEENIRMHMEMSGAYKAVAFGTALLVFWMPRQIIIIIFWFERINLVKYTISMKMATLVLELSVVSPFLAMLSTKDFRSGVYCIFTMTSMRAVRRKVVGQECYKTSIRKGVEDEVKVSSSHKTTRKKTSISNRSVSTVGTDRQAETPKKISTPELQPRNDYLISQDLTVIHYVNP
ncbi:hypothetical protein BsWGS_21562 [Bradybaena similaris]